MEPLTTTYPLKHSVPKARVFVVFLSMFLCTIILCLLQLRFFKPKIKDFYSFNVKDSRGRIISLEKYRGKVKGPNLYSISVPQDRITFTQIRTTRASPSYYSIEIPKFPSLLQFFTAPLVRKLFQHLNEIFLTALKSVASCHILCDTSYSSKKEPRWNFWKYLVSPEGKVVKFWRPEEPTESIKPEVASLIRQIIMKKREDL
ncbi:GPX8B peroxidase, partial [Nyctibius bracteatus]|nr:GPX8B peroxidase [Nyctibius bracteatus]